MRAASSGGRRGVDSLSQADERDSERLQIVEQCDQVLQRSPEPIEPPTHEHIEPAPLGIRQELVEGRASFSRTRDALVDILGWDQPRASM